MARQRRSNVKPAQHQPVVVPTRDSTAPVITPAGGLSATPAASNVGIMPRVAVSPPSPSSASSDDEDVKDGRGAGASSRPVSLTPDGSVPVAIDTEDTATCQWEDCGIVFTEMQKLVDHIHSEHIGVHKSSYTCEWASCLRRGLPQTSRFALISHIRSHTGEKPFTCTLPECDKSFTRSDALAKHMRLQHNISPPAPGRGGSRKRKRGLVDDTGSTPPTATPPGSVTGPTITIPPSGNFGTFKIEPNTPSELAAGGDEGNESDKEHTRGVDIGASASTASNARGKREKGEKANGRGKRGPPKPSPLTKNNHSTVPSSQPEDMDEEVQFAGMNTTNHPREEEDDGYSSSNSDVLPSYLQSQLDETSGLIRGKTPAKVMYLLMKAKFEYAIKERENLLGELQKGKIEAKQEKDEKEGALDELLKRMLGPESEILMQMPGLPEGPPLLPPSSVPTAHPHGSSIPPFSQSTYRPLPPPHSSNSHSHYRDAYVVAPGPSISNNDPYRQPPPPSFGMQNGSTRSHAHDRERRVSMSSTRGN